MKRDRKKWYGKIFLTFFLAMAVCTVLSRVADSMTVPKVSVKKAEEGKITYSLRGTGTVKTTSQSSCLLPEGFLVEACLENGTVVEEGDVLVRFQKEQLNRRRQELATAFEQAKLQLERAKLECEENAWIPAAEVAQANLNQAQTAYDEAAVEKQQVTEGYSQAMAEMKPEDKDYEEKKRELEAGIAEAESRLTQAEEGLRQAQQELESANRSDEITRKNNAKAAQLLEYAVKGAQLEVEQAKKKLQEADALIVQDGTFCAKEKGIFFSSSAAVGSVTTGNEFVSIGTGGFSFEAEVSGEDGKKLALGDRITVKISGKEEVEAPITRITTGKGEADNEAEMTLIQAELPEITESFSNCASFSVRKDSQEYQNILPLTAIRQDAKGYYCLGIRKQDSILGEETRAVRINLTLLEKDGNNVAVEGAILSDTKIIVASEKDVLPGNRVRVEE